MFNKNIRTSQQKGFTLIELLLVITLVSISIGVTSDILLSLIKSYNKTNAINETEQQANFIGLKLEKELRNATSVTVLNAGTQMYFDYNGTTVYYNVANNNLYRSVGAASTAAADALVGTPAILTTLSGVNFMCVGTCFTVTGTNPQIVTLSFALKQAAVGGVSFTGEINVKNTIVIRNTY